MSAAVRFRHTGVVEGFYGAVWDMDARRRLLERLRPFGMNAYLYAPKHETSLAAEALAPLAGADARRLGDWAAFCEERGVAAWAGLHLEPPFTPERHEHVARVADKLLALHRQGFTTFAVLFDDLQAGPLAPHRSMAEVQATAVTALREALERAGARPGWVVCPSRYTLDPWLERQFGPFEAGYLERLDALLPGDIPWFWTGPRVCSPAIAPADLREYRGRLGRELILWDNYPVNDLAMADELHLGPLTGRDPGVAGELSGYLFNPMAQADLGAVPGATCLQWAADPAAYTPEHAWWRAAEAVMPRPARRALAELEALTRHSCLVANGQAVRLVEHPLAERLRAAWEERERAPEPMREAGGALETLVQALREDLPPAMEAEAAPWLERLSAAADVFRQAAEARGSAARHRAAERYRASGAAVLGEWFEP